MKVVLVSYVASMYIHELICLKVVRKFLMLYRIFKTFLELSAMLNR